MTPDEWSFVKEAFETLRPLSPRERETYWSASYHFPAMRAEVDSLLEVYESNSEFLERPALAMGCLEFADVPHGGGISCYEIVRRIGEGGMSTVYEAYRSHGDFRQHVAIKVLKLGMDTTALLLRFRLERQILADFQHSHIAQLLDGGAMPDGRPFLVMEFIDGVPITEFCDKQKLSVAQRLHLFLQVCSAVQAAHRNLIVHRDIKPSNILVTSQGECKLLDFGIAKILEPDRYERTLARTVAAERLFTPDYASPEQIRGETITTSTDIYSLGVLLYEILAGRPPYRFESLQPDAIAREIETQEVLPPSAIVPRAERHANTVTLARSTTPAKLRRAIKGDLDKIVLRALRKEPDRRYQSVEQLADDVRRHQQGLPVTARRETVGYLARKFLSRNKAVSLVAMLLFLAILTGTAGAWWQAHRAEIERQRAERRFAELRRVANSLVFEMHDAIANLPGSRAPRELLLSRAAEMLDGLAKDTSNDPGLDLELAAAFSRLSEVQGHPMGDSRGDIKAALESMRKAVRLDQAAVSADSRNLRAQSALGVSHQNLSIILSYAGNAREAENAIEQAIRIHESVLIKTPGDYTVRGDLGVDYQRRGALRTDHGDFTGALEDQRKSVALLEDVVHAQPNVTIAAKQLAFAHKRVGALLMHLKKYNEALQEYFAALAIEDPISAAHPEDANNAFNRTFAYNDIGGIYYDLGQFDKSLEYHRKALAIRETQLARDPGSERARSGVERSMKNVAAVLATMKDWKGALETCLRQIELLEHDSHRASAATQVQLSAAHSGAAQAYAGLKHWSAAEVQYHRALAILQDLKSRSELPSGSVRDLSTLAADVAECQRHVGPRQ